MCYLKPGPRCSNHAKKARVKAFRAVNNDPTPENLVKLAESTRIYDSTTTGQKELVSAIAECDSQKSALTAGSSEYNMLLLKKDTLENRLRNGKELKKSQMRAYRQTQRRSSELLHNGASRVSQNAPKTSVDYVEHYSADNLPYGGLYGMDARDYDLEVDYTSKCPDHCQHDDYCRESTITVNSVSVYNPKKFAAALFSCSEEYITPDLEEWVQNNPVFKDVSNYDIHIGGDYYGEELRGLNFGVSHSEEVHKKIQEIQEEAHLRQVSRVTSKR